jgi:RND family efflux transporter MFP subunit
MKRRGIPVLVLLFGLGVVGKAEAATPALYTVRALTEPVADVVLSARVPGQVAKIHHDEGDFVKSGTVLLEFEQKTELLEVERKQVQLETLQGELERSELLFKTSSSMPREELDRKRGEVAVARVELAQAKELVVHRQVIAPFDGIITLLPVKVGAYCDLAGPVMRMVDSREFHAVSNADPARAGHVRVGEKLTIEMGTAAGPVILEGVVVFVSPVVDPASGLMRLKVKFSNPESRVRPGVAGMLHIPAPNGP